ncbi:MAG TPA: SDR family NAD(P)-dependent oxidoreductase, partial [Caldilineae bacterium]|nr:SDR family NAD(P)-dependent oxidoreductase [Caldilineae bacterium]
MNLTRFTNQVVIITGAASGIGRACAERFAQEGANIACLDFDADRNEETAKLCRSFGVEALAFKCDVTQKSDLQTAVGATLEAWGRLDVLVASAGI